MVVPATLMCATVLMASVGRRAIQVSDGNTYIRGVCLLRAAQFWVTVVLLAVYK